MLYKESPEKRLHALLITRLPTLPTGRQAQAGISKVITQIFMIS